MNLKKALLAVGVFACLAYAGKEAYEFYIASQPPVKVGECFEIKDAEGINCQVVENKDSVTYSVCKLEILPGVQVQIPIKASYAEMRGPDIKGASCQ